MFVSVRILSNANNCDNGEHSRTAAKSAALLHTLLHGSRASRDPSNTQADLRDSLEWCGLRWVTSHVIRKTTATLLDDAGLSARSIANQLGHAQPSRTQNVYMRRKIASTEAAGVLEQFR